MAATDSTLKTQMYLGESQRQNALDFSSSISSMFSAISEGQRFAGEVNRSMVQSALNYKQVEMDEYFKNEALKMDARKLALQEKETEIRLKQESDRIKIAERESLNRERYYKAKEYKEAEDKKYNHVIGEISSEGFKIEAEIKSRQDRIDALKSQHDVLRAKELDLADRYKKDHLSMPYEEYQRQLQSIQSQQIDLLSQSSTIHSELPDFQKRLGSISSLSQIAKSRARPADQIFSEFESTKKSWETPTIPAGTITTQDRSYKPGTSPIPSFSPQASAPTFGWKDLQIAFSAENDSWNPDIVRTKILPNLTPEKKAEFGNQYISAQRSLYSSFFTKDIPASTDPSRNKGLETFVSKASQIIQPDSNLFASDRVMEIAQAAQSAYQEWTSIDSEQREPKNEFLQRKIGEFLRANENKNLPPKASASAAASAFSGLSLSGGQDVREAQGYSRNEILASMFPDPEQRALADVSGEADDLIYSQAEARKRFGLEKKSKEAYYTEGKPDAAKILSELKKYSPEELGIDILDIDEEQSLYSSMPIIKRAQTKEDRLKYLIQHPEEAIQLILKKQLTEDPDLKRLRER